MFCKFCILADCDCDDDSNYNTLVALAALYVADSSRTRNYLTKVDLVPFDESPWSRTRYELFTLRNDKPLLALTGFNLTAFTFIVHQLERVTVRDTSTRGRKPVDTITCVAMTLFFLCSTLRLKFLSYVFGIPPTTVSDVLNRTIRALTRALNVTNECAIQWPDIHKMDKYNKMISARSARVGAMGVFAFMDGVRLPVQEPHDKATQNEYYNGWVKSCNVVNLFVGAPDGTIIAAYVNMPGCFHDARIFQKIDHRILNTPHPYSIAADSAFPHNGPYSGNVRTPLKDDDALPSDPIERTERIRDNRALIFERQAAEWMMRAYQGSFPRVTVPLTINKRYRFQIIYLTVLLYNLKSNIVGVNQIKTVYDTSDADVIGIARRAANSAYLRMFSECDVTFRNNTYVYKRRK